jgi:hypothetical protein
MTYSKLSKTDIIKYAKTHNSQILYGEGFNEDIDGEVEFKIKIIKNCIRTRIKIHSIVNGKKRLENFSKISIYKIDL